MNLLTEMADLAKSKKLRGFTRSKVTKLMNRAQELISDDRHDEIPVVTRSLEACAQTLANQDQEILELLSDPDSKDEIWH